MLILSDKLLLDIQLMHTFMPNMIHKPWMVSKLGILIYMYLGLYLPQHQIHNKEMSKYNAWTQH